MHSHWDRKLLARHDRLYKMSEWNTLAGGERKSCRVSTDEADKTDFFETVIFTFFLWYILVAYVKPSPNILFS